MFPAAIKINPNVIKRNARNMSITALKALLPLFICRYSLLVSPIHFIHIQLYGSKSYSHVSPPHFLQMYLASRRLQILHSFMLSIYISPYWVRNLGRGIIRVGGIELII